MELERNPVAFFGHERLDDLEGVERLEIISLGDSETLAVNYAMAMHVALRSTHVAIATGRDVSLVGTPSQDLLVDIMLSMPIRDDETTEGGRALYDHFLSRSSPENESTFKEFIAQFIRTVQWSMNSPDKITIEERNTASKEISPSIYWLSQLCEGYIDKHFDDERHKLMHEGGDTSIYENEIFSQFVEKDYINMLFNTAEMGNKTGLSRQVRLKLLEEARYLDSH